MLPFLNKLRKVLQNTEIKYSNNKLSYNLQNLNIGIS